MIVRLVHSKIERNDQILTFFEETLKSLDETENFPTRKQNAIPKLFFVGSRTGLNWFAGLLSECEKMAVFRDGQNNRTRRLAGRKERKRAVITGVAFGLYLELLALAGIFAAAAAQCPSCSGCFSS